MRIAVIGPRPPLRGGIAAHTSALERVLVARGHELLRVGFSRLYPPGLFPGRSEQQPDADTCPTDDDVRVDSLNPRTWSAAQRVISAAHCDRILYQWWHPFFSRAAARLTANASAPVVAICHNARPHEAYPGWRRATVRGLAGADLLVCHSQSVSDELGQLAPRLPRNVVSMPVLVPAAGVITRADARRQLGLRQHARLALFAGHARRYKGAELLLTAWDQAELPSMAGLVIAGESYLGRGHLEDAAARCRRRASIRIIDRYLGDDELGAWLAAADVLVLPYLRASQSGLLGAAEIAGTKIIASDTGGLAEQAREADAFLVAPGSVEQLAVALSRALARDAMLHTAAGAMVLAREEHLAVACEGATRRE